MLIGPSLLFERSPGRAQASIDAVATIRVTRVLDVGCGAGQELRPFVESAPVFGLGLDAAPEVGRAGRALFAEHRLSGRVAYARGFAESIPCHAETFDVVVCRLALPYTRNEEALAEMARVLRPGGVLLLKYHHVRFYIRSLKQAIAAGSLRRALYAARVLVAGSVYHIFGRQPTGRLLRSECYQTDARLRRTLTRLGLRVRGVARDSTPETPSLIVIKTERKPCAE